MCFYYWNAVDSFDDESRKSWNTLKQKRNYSPGDKHRL